jgi:hypothetical protein
VNDDFPLGFIFCCFKKFWPLVFLARLEALLFYYYFEDGSDDDDDDDDDDISPWRRTYLPTYIQYLAIGR